MTTKFFGTDGIRGPFGEPPLDRHTVVALGAALASDLRERKLPPLVVLGGDTRASTPDLCRWLATGLASGACEVDYIGTIPTPGVAFRTRQGDAGAGIAVSASHNRLPDNGIKLIANDGFKWESKAEAALERRLIEGAPPADSSDGSTGSAGSAGSDTELEIDTEAVSAYMDHLVAILPGEQPLEGLKIVLDCAHGAASAYAPELFTKLGAEVQALFDQPDGANINEGCGSTQPGKMASAVTTSGAALGIAFDGDADRALFADENGKVRDGDATLYLWAKTLSETGVLRPAKIVATSMSNLGLEVALREIGIETVRCDVGDRHVVETLRSQDLLLGGEQSGHIVHLGLSTTGDGMLTALQLAAIVHRAGRPLSELLRDLPQFPQTLKNIRVAQKPAWSSLPRVAASAAEVEEKLGDTGRLVLRYSGTEPLARVMIEGPDQQMIETLADQLLSVIGAEIGER